MRTLGEEYLRAYDKLIPGAYKADVWRYGVVWSSGGCYMDAGSFTVRPLVEMIRETD